MLESDTSPTAVTRHSRPYDLSTLPQQALFALMLRRPDLRKEVDAELATRCEYGYAQYGV